MNLNLDFVAGMLCTLAAFALCVIHIISSKKRGQWITLPEYVRVGLFATAITLLYRGVNFITIAGAARAGSPLVGRINAEGLIATAALTYTLCALALFLARKAYPEGVWRSIVRTEWVAKLMSRSPPPPYIIVNARPLAPVDQAEPVRSAPTDRP